MRSYRTATTPKEFTAGFANSITPAVMAKWEAFFKTRSAEVLASGTERVELSYGSHPRQRLDFFPAQSAASDSPTLVAIHGGIWLYFDRWMMHFLVPAFTAAGINVVCPGYRVAPQASLNDIVEDCISAVRYLTSQESAARLQTGRMSVLGHSAGAQLAAVLASRDWTGDRSFGGFHSFIGVSGFYEIEAFALTDFQRMVNFSESDYRRWNPLESIAPGMPPALLLTGGKESPWLHEMSARYAARLRDVGTAATVIDAAGECHFSVLNRIGEADSPLHRAVLELL
jgi:arylformamidase